MTQRAWGRGRVWEREPGAEETQEPLFSVLVLQVGPERAGAGTAQSWDSSGAGGPARGKHLFPGSSCPDFHKREERTHLCPSRYQRPQHLVAPALPGSQLRLICQFLSGEQPVPRG